MGTKKILAGVGATLLLAGGASAPLIPVTDTFQVAYAAPVFDTPSGQLDDGYYAFNESGKSLLIHSSTTPTTAPDGIAIFDITAAHPALTGLRQARIIDKTYLAQYTTYSGGIATSSMTSTTYATIGGKNGAQAIPTHTEMLSPAQMLVAPLDASAAIAHDADSTNGSEILSSSYTFTHTTSAGATMMICNLEETATYSGNTPSVTFDAKTMTFIQNADWPGSTVASDVMFGQGTPDIGTNLTVAVTFNNGSTHTSGVCTSYLGSSTAVPPEVVSPAIALSGSVPFTATISTLTNNAWVVAGENGSCGGSRTAAANTTMRDQVTSASQAMMDTNAAQTPLGSHTVGTTDACGSFRGVAISLAPAGGGAAAPYNDDSALLPYLQ